MRVSIVATALDGQQPEPKSVINMVHRIQNRNSGYSEFNNTGSSQSFSFSNNNNSIITHGANALKLEDEVKNENLETSNSNELNVSNLSSSSHDQNESEIIDELVNHTEERQEDENKLHPSNGLENFEIQETNTPDLFNSDNVDSSEDLPSASDTI